MSSLFLNPVSPEEFSTLARRLWPLPVIRGALAIVFGVLALIFPIGTALVLAVFIGAYALVDGVIDIVEAIRHRGSAMALRIVLGAIGVIFGIVVLVWPGKSLGALIILIGVWAIILGVVQVFSSVVTRSAPNSGWVWGGGGRCPVAGLRHPGAGPSGRRTGVADLDHRRLGDHSRSGPDPARSPDPQGRPERHRRPGLKRTAQRRPASGPQAARAAVSTTEAMA